MHPIHPAAEDHSWSHPSSRSNGPSHSATRSTRRCADTCATAPSFPASRCRKCNDAGLTPNLDRLASEGLLASDGRSFVVPSLSLEDVDDIYEVRFLLEPAAMRRVAELTPVAAVRAPIDEALAAASAAYKSNDADAFRESNIRFRNAWIALVPNRRLVRAIEQYADHMMRIRALTLGDQKVRTIVIKGLKRIAEALAAGNGDDAATAMRDHLSEAKRCFIAATGLDQAAKE